MCAADYDEPHALMVLVEEELVVIDLETSGWPAFRPPYLNSVHSSAITCAQHVLNVPDQLWQKLVDAGDAQSKNFSARVSGGVLSVSESECVCVSVPSTCSMSPASSGTSWSTPGTLRARTSLLASVYVVWGGSVCVYVCSQPVLNVPDQLWHKLADAGDAQSKNFSARVSLGVCVVVCSVCVCVPRKRFLRNFSARVSLGVSVVVCSVCVCPSQAIPQKLLR